MKVLFPTHIEVTLKKALPNIAKGTLGRIELDPSEYDLSETLHETKAGTTEGVLGGEEDVEIHFECEEKGGEYMDTLCNIMTAKDFFKVEVVGWREVFVYDGNFAEITNEGVTIGCVEIKLDEIEALVAAVKKTK